MASGLLRNLTRSIGKHSSCVLLIDRFGLVWKFNWFVLACSAPIEAGLPSDAGEEEKQRSHRLLRALQEASSSYIHRRGKACLEKLLPPLTDTLLHIQPSTVQEKMAKQFTKGREKWNFFK